MSRVFKRVRAWFAVPIHYGLVLFSLIPPIVLWFYIQQTVRNFPRFDQGRQLPMVYAAARGDLTIRQFLEPFMGHIAIPTNLLTVVLIHTTQWNVALETYFNLVLGAINLGLAYMLLAHTHGRAWVWGLIPFSALVFSIGQDMNWMLGYYNMWHFALLFFLLALLTVIKGDGRWWALGLSALWGLMATLSLGGGVVAFPAVLVYLVLRPQRSWKQIGVWGILMLLAVVAQTFIGGAEPQGDNVGFHWYTPLQYALFSLAYPGGVLGYGAIMRGTPFWYALILSVGGLLLMLVNGIYAYRQRVGQELLPTWLAVGSYSMGMGLLVAYGRFAEYGYARIYETWYFTSQIPFWLAVVAVSGLGFGTAIQKGKAADHFMLYLNLTALFIGMVRYFPANYYPHRHPNSVFVKSMFPNCGYEALLTQTTNPDCVLFMGLPDVNQLAHYRLALFAELELENVMAEVEPSLPILLETHNPWLNVHVRDYFLAGVEPERLFHHYPENPDAMALIHRPPEQVIHVDDPMFLADSGEFWHLRRIDFAEPDPVLWEALANAGYLAVDTVRRTNRFHLSRVIQPPEALDEAIQFGEAVTLDALTVRDPIRACEPITVETLWHTDADQGVGFSLTLQLLDDEGNAVVKQDAGLGTVQTDQWLVDQPYSDTRTIELPCELPAGDYTLAGGVYFYQAPDDLFAVDNPVAGEVDNLAALAKIEVTS